MPLLRTLLHRAGLPQSDRYSSHSLRRDFATWASSNQWDLEMLMGYIDQKGVHSAMRYVDMADPFTQHRIETALSIVPPPGITG